MKSLTRADRARNARAVADAVKRLSDHGSGLLNMFGANELPLVGLSMSQLRGIRDEI